MTRIGWFMLLAIAIVVALFVALVRRGGGEVASTTPAPAAVTAPAAALTAGGGGATIMPVTGVAPRQLTDTWGDARADGTRAHHAIDIMAPTGTPVVAAAAGTVEKLFESHNGGHTVYIRRADRAWQDYYAHLDTYAPDLREGVAVRAGQQIGTVGATGDADPAAPHLHYEIHRMAPADTWSQGTEINPYPILHALPG